MKKICYIGYVGYGSFGDDMCWDILRNHLIMKSFLKEKGYSLSVRDPYMMPVSKDEDWDYYIIGAGTCLSNFMRPWADGIVESIMKTGKPYSMFGTAVYFESERTFNGSVFRATDESLRRTKEYVKNANLICLRDEASVSYFKMFFSNKEIIAMGDAALSYSRRQNDRKPYYIGFNFSTENLSCLGAYMRNGYRMRENVMNFLKSIDDRIVFVPFNYADMEFLKYIRNSLYCYSVSYRRFRHIFRISKIVSQCRFFVGERVHADVICTALGIPFLSITYTAPNENFLDHIGWPKKYRMYSYDLGNDKFSIRNKFEDLKCNNNTLKRILYIATQQAKTKYNLCLVKLIEDIHDCLG